ncbi:hypothetical protein Snas_2670 [Stackebrandtia nassauensis DSM 44728]|uniref:Uncharacterized protein n=1 Tax=Stackebrandtia nassauensis (strain DSM 44728 / CIP 108903 / NRRL B-16338 / NBRC 102104 / LLR-40K-21) TaxID=446470 RepID=D3Q776_STANL|nr:hypothetical protein Snas_2670 [Stackebrandtia nassauensis DSM 44728]
MQFVLSTIANFVATVARQTRNALLRKQTGTFSLKVLLFCGRSPTTTSPPGCCIVASLAIAINKARLLGALGLATAATACHCNVAAAQEVTTYRTSPVCSLEQPPRRSPTVTQLLARLPPEQPQSRMPRQPGNDEYSHFLLEVFSWRTKVVAPPRHGVRHPHTAPHMQPHTVGRRSEMNRMATRRTQRRRPHRCANLSENTGNPTKKHGPHSADHVSD